ncbi:MAG: tetratricopeptide repeat protein [Candidatus Eremiobacteraeota bacterium]|nr:tetratricopeptide repeat protein [Candidatus Eremiobacteraeota bacterium]
MRLSRGNLILPLLLLFFTLSSIFLPISLYAQESEGFGDIEAGINLMGQHEYEKALEHFNKAVRANPKNPRAHFFQATALYWLKRYQEADTALDKARRYNDQNYLIWYYKGKVANAQKRYKTALAYFEKSIEYNPVYKESWFEKGLILFGMKQYRACIGTMGRVIGLDNTDGRAYCIMGMAYFWLGDMQKSKSYISKGLSLNPSYKDKIPDRIKKAVGL